MRLFATFAAASLLFGSAAFAETTVSLEKTHLCCGSCVKGAEKAVSSVAGAKATCDKDAGKVTITAPDAATAQKAVDALVAAGYYGTPTGGATVTDQKLADGKVKSADVSQIHNCCKKCTTAFNKTIKEVPGATGTVAEKAKTFTVSGDFDAQKLEKALHDAGLNGKIETK